MVRFRTNQSGQGFVYVLRSLDPTWGNRIKVGLSLDVVQRGKQLFTTGVPFPFVPYCVWAVSDMALAEKIAHDVLDDHRINRRREHFDVIPAHRRGVLVKEVATISETDILGALDGLLKRIDESFEYHPKIKRYSVDVQQLNDYSRERKRTNDNPNNPSMYEPPLLG